MIDIYICEDNLEQLNLITKYVLDSVMIEALDMRLVKASPDPHIILNELKHGENTGLFFLDIDLKADMDGLSLAQCIRKLQPRCFIIFITSHSEMSFLTFQYKVEALDFIIKDGSDQIKRKVHECLLNVEEKYTSINNNLHKTFLINLAEKRIAVDYDEIIFFETSPTIHKIILHGQKRVIEFSGQLKDIEEQLDYRFCRCHRSYIINRDYIAEVDFANLVVHMKNGETCPVAIRMKRKLKKLMS